MAEELPKAIGIDEILVRFISDRNFKNKIIDLTKLVTKDIFLPYKGGVSLQRGDFLDENGCKIFAKKVGGRKFVGFMIFKRQKFEELKANFIKNNNENFDAQIIASPLDENFEYIIDFEKIFITDEGNPTHADIKYFNPKVEEEVPNSTIRSFSRKFSKVCKTTLDNYEVEGDNFNGDKFLEII